MQMPGSGDDEVTRLRDSTILAVHSGGVEFFNKEYDKSFKEISDNVYYQTIKNLFKGPHFIECWNHSPKRECVEYAVAEKLVPSFDVYARQIDDLVNNGKTPACTFISHPLPNKGERND